MNKLLKLKMEYKQNMIFYVRNLKMDKNKSRIFKMKKINYKNRLIKNKKK